MQLGSLTLLPGPPGLSVSYALLEIGPCAMIVSHIVEGGWAWVDIGRNVMCSAQSGARTAIACVFKPRSIGT